MTLRLPRNVSFDPLLNGRSRDGASVLEYELLAEKAAALGHAEKQLKTALKELEKLSDSTTENETIYGSIAKALYAYQIQRELCGLFQHDSIYKLYHIPKQAIARVGAL